MSGFPRGGGGGSVTFAGDLSGDDTTQTVVGIQGEPVSATDPATGEVLVFDGTEYVPGSGPPSTFPILLDDGTFLYQVDADAGAISAIVTDKATGSFVGHFHAETDGTAFANAFLAGATPSHQMTASAIANEASGNKFQLTSDGTFVDLIPLDKDPNGSVDSVAGSLVFDTTGRLWLNRTGGDVWADVGGAQLVQREGSFIPPDLATLFSAPVEVLPAPGVGFAYQILSVNVVTLPGVGLFDNAGPALIFGTDPSTMPSSASDVLGCLASQYMRAVAGLNSAFTGQSLNACSVGPAQSTIGGTFPFASTNGVPLSAIENQPICLAAQGADAIAAAPMLTATPTSGGTGYAVGDTGVVDADQFTGNATYTVLTETGGAVDTVSIDTGGDGYVVGHSLIGTNPDGSQPGIGTGLTLEVVTIDSAAIDTGVFISVVARIFTTAP